MFFEFTFEIKNIRFVTEREYTRGMERIHCLAFASAAPYWFVLLQNSLRIKTSQEISFVSAFFLFIVFIIYGLTVL